MLVLRFFFWSPRTVVKTIARANNKRTGDVTKLREGFFELLQPLHGQVILAERVRPALKPRFRSMEFSDYVVLRPQDTFVVSHMIPPMKTSPGGLVLVILF